MIETDYEQFKRAHPVLLRAAGIQLAFENLWYRFRYVVGQKLLRWMGDTDRAHLREQNDRLTYAMRRMTRENNRMEDFLLKSRKEWATRSMILQDSIALKKHERNYYRDLLKKAHVCDHPTDCSICKVVATKHPFDVVKNPYLEAR